MRKTPDARHEATMPQRAYSYTRFSDPKQARGDSERRQTEWPMQIAQEQGWILDDTLTFVDRGKSGFHAKNLAPTAALTQFLDLVNRGRIIRGSVLIIENVDRLSRSDVDTAHDLFRSIIRAGIWVCTRTPFRIYKGAKDASFMDLLEPIWIMYVAHMESLKKSQRVASAWETARRRARDEGLAHHKPPCWLRRGPNGWEVVHEQLALVRRMAELTQQGVGAGELAERMTAEGHPGLGRSGRWNRSTVQFLLRSRILVGEYQPRQLVEGKWQPAGTPIAGYYPPALTEEEWQAVQASVSGRLRKRGRPARQGINLFTGLVWDAASRRKLAQQHAVSPGREDRYLIVPALTGGLKVRYDAFEKAVLDTIAMLRPEDVLEPEARADEREQRIAALTGRVTALTHRQEQLQQAAADPDQDAAALLPVLAHVAADLKTTAAERDRLQLETRSSRAESLTEAQTLRQLRDQARGAEREELDRRIRAALPNVVSEIWVQGQELGKGKRIVHTQIYLRSGTMRYVQVMPIPHAKQSRVDLHGVTVWQIEGHDLRQGPFQESDAAPLAETA